MAFKMSYAQLKKQQFRMAWGKICGFPGYKTPQIAYNIAKIKHKLDEELKVHGDVIEPLIKEEDEKVKLWGKKDENGKVIYRQEGPGVAFDPLPEHEKEWEEFRKAFKEKVKKAEEVEFEVDRPKIKYPLELEGVQLTPNELAEVDHMLEVDFDAVAAAPVAPTSPALVK